jgi:hypothetical protein
MVFDFRAQSLEACIERMQACAEGVMKLVD